MTLRAPFPWFGGKSRAAHLVWAAFGDVPNYVEPFAGSLAVLLSRPAPARIETVNDLDAHLANFWRAVAVAPEEVARWADWPVNEVDLHARHRWLVYGEGAAEFREAMRHDPELYDAKRAGWWVWGICQWIGSGWCSAGTRPSAAQVPSDVQTANQRRRPNLKDQGIRCRDVAGSADWEKRPVLAHSNRGVHLVSEQLPMLRGDSGAAGAGIHASGLVKAQLPDHGGAAGKGVTASAKNQDAILAWMLALQARLRRVRVCCGDWTRVLGRSATECIGTTGIFLDPPYGADAGRDPSLYTHDDLDIAAKVRAWAVEHGSNRKLRIAYCSYGEAPPPGGLATGEVEGERWLCSKRREPRQRAPRDDRLLAALPARRGAAAQPLRRGGRDLMPEQQSFPGLAPQDPPAWTSRSVEPGSAMARLEGESIYRKLAVRMHADEKVMRLAKPPPGGYALWLELLVGAQTDVIPGLFRIGEAGFAEQLGWPLKGFREAWDEVQRAELRVKADWKSRLVWVRNALRHNMPAAPNTVLSWKDCWRDRLPECALKEEARVFIQRELTEFSEPYGKAFEKVCGKPSPMPCDKASPIPSSLPCRNQEAVSSKQEAGDVVVAVDGVRGNQDPACGSVDNSLLDGLNPSDKAEIQALFAKGTYSQASARLAELRKRGEP